MPFIVVGMGSHCASGNWNNAIGQNKVKCGNIVVGLKLVDTLPLIDTGQDYTKPLPFWKKEKKKMTKEKFIRNPRISVAVPDELNARITRVADYLGISKPSLLAMICANGLSTYEMQMEMEKIVVKKMEDINVLDLIENMKNPENILDLRK